MSNLPRLAPLAPSTDTACLSAAVFAIVSGATRAEPDLDLARRIAREMVEDAEGIWA